MKIGIMTWFQYHNYGTALQLYALNEKCRNLGYDAYTINYLAKNTSGRQKIAVKMKNLINGYFYKSVYGDSGRRRKFQDFLEKNVKFTERCATLGELEDLNDSLDAFICGSDQIWSPLCFDSHYFLDFVSDSNRMLSYAPSIGTFSINNKEIENRIKKLASRFSHLSLREASGARLISELTGRSAATVLDPTLLLERDEWMKIAKRKYIKQEGYGLVYMLGQEESHWKRIGSFSKEARIPVVVIPVYERDFKRAGCLKEPVGPQEFIALIDGASFVFTDSFHGTIFAMNFNKPFCVFERFKKRASNNQNSRIHHILELTGLTERIFKPGKRWDDYVKKIDFGRVNQVIGMLRKESVSYLKEALEQIQRYLESGGNPKKKNIRTNHTLCCGCGVCSCVCPANAISIEYSRDGFKEAVIDGLKCISCGKCEKVCPFVGIRGEGIEGHEVYSYKDLRNSVLSVSSSGGLAYALSELALDSHYDVCGCAFDRSRQNAEHIVVSSREELHRLQGSKYMQSDFERASKLLVDSKKAVIFGLPCQISAARKLRGGDGVYIDLICHGVPSYNLYKKYQDYLARTYSMDTRHMDIIFRYKPSGWRERDIYTADSRKKHICHQSKDPYFLSFEHGICYAEQCFECPFRDKSEADLRIGDFWGPMYDSDKTGVSMAVVLTQTGRAWMEELEKSQKGRIEAAGSENYFRYQQTVNVPKPLNREKFLGELQENSTRLEKLVSVYVAPLEKERRFCEKVGPVLVFVKRRLKKALFK
ncbi:polysaccharide pyruvyl transferase family protein [Sporofaciens musculi]|uniref:polysaccharide pyruvyl transferase family protein n=1 Tax=Sporofaciens musculi TaxID=2681861 RepID=UPI0025A2B4DB|nr:polysaccharide pyruvyl transferase family protein [Sporofaciens musculi]